MFARPAHSTTRKERGAFWLAVLILPLATAVAYHNSLSVPWLFDDAAAIGNNPTLRQPAAPLAELLFPPAASPVAGRPLANLSFALNYAAGGENVRGYHLVNLAIHILAGWTLFGIVRRTLGLRREAPAGATTVAAYSAILWAVHPLATVSVTYVSQRTESLMGLCYLLTLYGFIRATRAQHPWRWLAGSVAVCAAGMAVKEVMATAPLLVLLYDRTFVTGSFRAAWRNRRPYYTGLAATWLLLAALLNTGLEQRHVGFDLGVSVARYALTECQALLTYLRLALWPHPLVFDYGPVFVANGSQAVGYVVAVAGLLAATILLLLRRPAAGFAAAGFFLILAPTSSVVPVALQPIAENRAYLPLALVITAVVTATHGALGRSAGLRLSLVGLALTALTVQRNATYRSPLALWNDTVAKSPANARAHENLAQTLCALNRPTEAIAHYENAARLNPRSAITEAMLGNAWLQLQNHGRAARHFTRAIELDPGFVVAHINLGFTLYVQGNYEAAAASFSRALRLDPVNASALRNLSTTLERLGRPLEAAPFYLAALQAAPDHATNHNSYGLILARGGRLEEARPHFQRAIELQPDFAEARDNLARLGAGNQPAGSPPR